MRVPAILMLLVALPAHADDEGILKCRSIASAAARLACYDGLPTGGEPKTSPRGARPGGPAGMPPGAFRGGPPGLPLPPGDPGARGAMPAAGAAPAIEQFGFEHKQEILKVEAIESTIPGRFEGWRANENIRLANGQVWQVVDDSRASLWMENPKVRVRRGALGAFYLEIAGTNRSPRVRRLQ